MLEFDNKKAIGFILTRKNITEKDVEDIIVNAFEGSISYWASLKRDEEWKNKPREEASSMWATKLLLERKEVFLYDSEAEDGEEELWALTLEKLISGIQQNIDKRPFDCDLDNADAITYDCIIQYALFNDIIYG